MNRKPFIAALAASVALHAFSLLLLSLGIWFCPSSPVPAGEESDVLVSFFSDTSFPSPLVGGGKRERKNGIATPFLKGGREVQNLQASEGGDTSTAGSPNGDVRLSKIAGRINGAKFYPAKAREALIEGAPKVTFSIREDGSLQNLGIASSSGTNLLDEAAMEAVRRAAPLPFYPDPITLTLRYSLAHR